MKKRVVFVFIIPLALILVSIYSMNRFNKNKIKSQFEKITFAEGLTIRSLMEAAGRHLAEEGTEELKPFLNKLYNNERIVYIGLFKGNELTFLLSRFEGYFPVVGEQAETRVLDSPMGKIFEITAAFTGQSGLSYRLHIGFDFQFLTALETTVGRNFLIVAALFFLVMLLVLAMVTRFDKKFFQKDMELLEEKQLKERFKELSLLTSEIAHEIKNPLNSIYLSFNTLEKFCSDDQDALFYRGAIKGEIKRISGILQSYSDLSKEIRPQVTNLDIAGFADEFHLLMKGELETKKINFRFKVEEETKAEEKKHFKTDKNLLKQILLNLTKNSIEAGASEISIFFTPGNNTLTLLVKDNGKGIAEAVRASIFKPYISTKTKGMGLGLHITLRIIRALNGTIELVSHVPGNTVFKVILPGEGHRK